LIKECGSLRTEAEYFSIQGLVYHLSDLALGLGSGNIGLMLSKLSKKLDFLIYFDHKQNLNYSQFQLKYFSYRHKMLKNKLNKS